ncbi:MAG: transglycosylase domain-containing protein [Saccharofermentanales bacterium]
MSNKKSYSKSTDAVRKAYHKRLRGRPSHSSINETVPQTMFVVIKQFFKVIIITLVLLGLTLTGVGAGMMVGYVSTAQPLNVWQLKGKNETSYIYDSKGNVLAKLTGSQNIDREYITYDKFSGTYIEKAFKAIEDERFDTHIGIDYKRIVGALLSFITTAGNPTSGGSTITQQTVKMISGENELSAQRKIQEWYTAIRLERQLKKWQIMELYVNLVPMGNSYIGIQSAAKAYFGKNASELNLPECAFLVGVPNLPGRYNPLTESGRRNAFRRQRIVLGKMLDLGYITKEQYTDALETEIRFVTKAITNTSVKVNSYFVDYTIEQVKKDLMVVRGYSSSLALTTIYNYGCKIYTTMDSSIQSILDTAFKTESLFVTNKAMVADFPEHVQGGMAVIDPKSAQIKALAGGFGVKDANFVLNRATGIERQPGSTIKPIAVYAPAIDLGKVTASTIIVDKPLYLNKETPNVQYPKNSYKSHLGPMTVRNGLKISSNTFAAQVWMKLGGLNSLEYLKRVGLDRPSENYLSIAFGGFNKGMSPLDMAAAYQPFANNGQYAKPICYTKVTDVEGNIILNGVPRFDQVYKPETAAIMNSLLQEPLLPANTAFGHGGTAPGYGIKNKKGEPITTSGKTGTADGNRDKWFVGYTPYYIGAVWYGYDGRLKTINIPSNDTMNAIKIWNNVMTKIHASLAPDTFYEPPTLIKREICISTGLLATDACRAAGSGAHRFVITENFLPGVDINPTTYCTRHVFTPKPTAAPTDIASNESSDIYSTPDSSYASSSYDSKISIPDLFDNNGNKKDK